MTALIRPSRDIFRVHNEHVSARLGPWNGDLKHCSPTILWRCICPSASIEQGHQQGPRTTSCSSAAVAEIPHCTMTAVDLKSGMIVGTETMLQGNESSWKLETQFVEKLLHRLKDKKNLVIAEVVHDDCGAVDVILRRMNIDSQKWVSTRKKDELVEIVWGGLFPNEAGKALPDDVVEIEALQTLHCNAAEEAKEWLYGACRLRERAKDDDGDVLATHVDPLYEAGGRVHFVVTRCLEQFASNTKMAYYTRARMTFNNECFHSVIHKYATKRPNFPKSYEARVCCTALEWNKNKRIRRLRTVFRKPTNVTHRRRSARQHIYAARDTLWRFDIATAVFGSPRVGDWARNMLQQSDIDDPVIEHYDEEADYRLPNVVESVVEGVVIEGDNVFVEAGSESASDDEKSSSDSPMVSLTASILTASFFRMRCPLRRSDSVTYYIDAHCHRHNY
ncbi:hypothetical protein CBR_g38978 [Chara braunii]|uniref:Uncharacterized protein n=1 Tax=Chara braunii TaxID=69332 RepID=A0A388K0W7_CHABU|nr:hypothetical protein CBR_g38978 [Chara braunii]|eukprot:GBG63666.1 hypothetical protein CBR_g38978 [Chara braunii]